MAREHHRHGVKRPPHVAHLVSVSDSSAAPADLRALGRHGGLPRAWYRLLAAPAAYRGKIVGLTGYLVSDFGNLILYPDKASYERGNEDDSIVLERPFTIPKEIVDKAANCVFPVYVLGRLGPRIEGNVHVVPRRGSLYDIHRIIMTPRIPSGTPLNMEGMHVDP